MNMQFLENRRHSMGLKMLQDFHIEKYIEMQKVITVELEFVYQIELEIE